jgi:CheY-like chemotaxis protein
LPPPQFARRVLIVDDNRDAADSFAEIVRQMGHHVRTAYEGRQALEAALSLRADIVFIDLVMPDLDGYAVARQLRSEPQFRHILIVALSGFGRVEDRERSREAGFDHHLLKPIDPEYLRSLLGRHR